MSHGNVESEPDASGGGARGLRGSDGRHDPTPGDEAAVDRIRHEEAAGDLEVDGADEGLISDGEDLEGEVLVQVARSYTGPLPHQDTLEAYERIVPGSAKRLIDEHIHGQRTASNALTRITRAESFSVSWGAVGAWTISFGGLAASVWLLVAGFPVGSIVALIPPVLAGAAQVVAAHRGGGK